MILWLYRNLARASEKPVLGWLKHRTRQGKENPTRLNERLGKPVIPRPNGVLIWIHAASVGEANSMLALIKRLDAQGAGQILVTTGTVTSAQLMARSLPAGAIHQFSPIDLEDAVDGFLDHWQPDVALWVESELWPNMVLRTAQRGTAMALVNARMSDRSFQRWRRVPGAIRPLLQCFDLCLAQSERDAGHFRKLGASPVVYTGNLKFSAEPLDFDQTELTRMIEATQGRALWMAASTHVGEEKIAARAHKALLEDHPDLLTIIAPRHPDRGDEIRRETEAMGLQVAQRSKGEAITDDTDIYLADTMGEMGMLYRLVNIAFVGGSLIPHGGQNPLEAARLDCAILYGPHMDNFRDPVAELESAGAARQVADLSELERSLQELLSSPALIIQRATAARLAAAAQEVILEQVIEQLSPLLNPYART